MVRSRSQVVAWALLTAVAVASPSWSQTQAAPSQSAAPAPRPFDPLLQRAATMAPGTYLINGQTVSPAPDLDRIPVLLQADVLRGAERTARVGIVVGAEAARAVDVRMRVWTVATGKEAARIMADAGGSGTAGPMRLVREFNLDPGEYDVEAVVGHPGNGGLIAALAKSHLIVPDVRAASPAVTPIVVGEAAPAGRRAEVPFVFGQTIIAPAVGPGFRQDGVISVAFRVYNWTAKPEEKPDLTVEYLFYEKGTKGLHFFNKVKPQQLNGDTLGDAFNPSAGSVAAGMKIPLGAFTFGDFQLSVRVTDNRSKQTAERQLSFAVVP